MQNILKQLFLSQKTLCSITPDPETPGDVPGEGGTGTTPPTYVPGYLGYSVKRHTTNVAVTEEMKVTDFINEVLFPASRMFVTQGANGKLRLRNKKPTTWGLATEEILTDATQINVDDVRDWIDNPNNLVLLDPYTTASEIHTIDSVSYSEDQNDVDLTASVNLTVVGFSGASGATPATATVTVDDIAEGDDSDLTLDGIAIEFNATSADTVEGIAAFLTAAINAHPKTARRFFASVVDDTITITGKFGTITFNEEVLNDHSAPVANPTTAATLTATASGSLKAGVYKLAYSFVNSRGQTLLSPVQSVTLADGEKIAVDAITPPAGCSVNWYIQPQPGSKKLRLHSTNDGSSFEIDSLPLLTATLPPDFNRTGAELMRVMASFTDRDNARSGRSLSNVLRASYEWLLGNRNKSINRIDLKYRKAFDDYRLIELRVSDLDNIAKIKKTLNLEVNGQAIDNDFQAVRIATSLLAEYRDADFYYTWKSTREALLLEEGDVVAITDRSSGVINLPVMIESLDFDVANFSIPRVKFTGRKYSSSLYDDSITDRKIPVLIEPENVFTPISYIVDEGDSVVDEGDFVIYG